MAQLTLRDIATQEEIIVPTEGFVFGRTGGDADIQIEDNSISRRQARVSNRQGTWVLEVMVVPPGQRLPRPQSLQEGQTFFIGQNEFEVLAVEAEGGDDADQDASAKTVAPSRAKPGPAPVAAPVKKPAPAAARGAPAAAPAKKPAPAAKPAARAAPVDDDAGDADEGGEPAKGGIGALFVGVPKGIAYYLLNVPKILVNPLGTVRNTIETQPNPPIAKVGLIGYALPALVIAAALPAFGTGIGLLLGPGHVFSLMSFIPIVPLISGTIGAVIIGFFWHPVLKWIIEKLQGESDERSRSNYFLQSMTLSILIAVPQALQAILSQIRWVNLLAPVVGLAGSLISAYVTYQWMVYFKVNKWIPKLILVGGALSVIFTAIGMVTLLMLDIHGLGGSSSASSGDAEIEAATAAAEEANAEAMKNMDSATAAQVKAAQKLAAEAAKGGKAAQEAAMKAAKEAQEAGAAAAEAGNKEAAKATAAAAKEEARAAKEEARAAKNPPREDPPEAAAAVDDAPAAAPSGAFGTYAHRREAIEKRLENDPTVLASDSELQKLYGNYVEASTKIEQEYQRKEAKDSEHTKMYEHLKNAELYKKTGGMVDKLSSKLGVR